MVDGERTTFWGVYKVIVAEAVLVGSAALVAVTTTG